MTVSMKSMKIGNCGAAVPKHNIHVWKREFTEIIVQRMQSGLEGEEVGQSSSGLTSLFFDNSDCSVLFNQGVKV